MLYVVKLPTIRSGLVYRQIERITICKNETFLCDVKNYVIRTFFVFKRFHEFRGIAYM